MTFLTSTFSVLQNAVKTLEGDLFSLMFGAYAKTKQARLRKLCRLEPFHTRSEYLGLQYTARLLQTRADLLKCEPTERLAQYLRSTNQDIQEAKRIELLGDAERKLSTNKAHEILKEQCLQEWEKAEIHIKVRRSPMPQKLFDLPPALKLHAPHRRLLAVNWLFHRFPRDPARIVREHRTRGETALQTIHTLLYRNKLDPASYAKLGTAIERVLELAPISLPWYKRRS